MNTKKHNYKWSDWFYYDETSPSYLRWKVSRYGGRNLLIKLVGVGDVAGSTNKEGYYHVKLESSNFRIHRIIYEMFNDTIPHGLFVDHTDGDVSNNKISNLRLADAVINSRNCRKNLNNQSGVSGVSFSTTKNNYSYWKSQWNDSNIRKCKNFSVLKLGNEMAFNMACEHHKEKLIELNAQGAGFTERHGT